MFAEDVDLLPNKMFRRMLEHAATGPDEFQALATMQSGGRVGFETSRMVYGTAACGRLLASKDAFTARRPSRIAAESPCANDSHVNWAPVGVHLD
jgi:hypothetical protein